MADVFKQLMNPALIWILIPLAVIIGIQINKGLQAHYEHKERMAKIEHGQDPDK